MARQFMQARHPSRFQIHIKNLLVCGDSCFPGIGVPAVSGSGMIAANSVSLDLIGIAEA